MSIQYDTPYSFTAADGTVAIIGPQDLGNANYIGIPSSITSVIEIRESGGPLVEGDGWVQGSNYYGRRIWTFEVLIDPGLTNLNAKVDQLNRATNAMGTDGTLTWTETGRVQTRSLYRRQAWTPSDEKRPHRVFIGLACANYRNEAATASTSGAGTLANAGNTPAPPTFTLTAPTNTITLTNSTLPVGARDLILTGLSGAGTVTVNFAAKTVTATTGTANRYSAVSFPSSTWWELQPGNNTVSVSGATVSGSGIAWRSSWL